MPGAAARSDDDERLVLENLRNTVAEAASGGGLGTSDMRLAKRQETAGRKSSVASPIKKEML